MASGLVRTFSRPLIQVKAEDQQQQNCLPIETREDGFKPRHIRDLGAQARMHTEEGEKDERTRHSQERYERKFLHDGDCFPLFDARDMHHALT